MVDKINMYSEWYWQEDFDNYTEENDKANFYMLETLGRLEVVKFNMSE